LAHRRSARINISLSHFYSNRGRRLRRDGTRGYGPNSASRVHAVRKAYPLARLWELHQEPPIYRGPHGWMGLDQDKMFSLRILLHALRCHSQKDGLTNIEALVRNGKGLSALRRINASIEDAVVFLEIHSA